MPYTIQINDTQLTIIAHALALARTDPATCDIFRSIKSDTYDNCLQEMEMLSDLFETLPTENSKCGPDTLHAFCL